MKTSIINIITSLEETNKDLNATIEANKVLLLSEKNPSVIEWRENNILDWTEEIQSNKKIIMSLALHLS